MGQHKYDATFSDNIFRPVVPTEELGDAQQTVPTGKIVKEERTERTAEMTENDGASCCHGKSSRVRSPQPLRRMGEGEGPPKGRGHLGVLAGRTDSKVVPRTLQEGKSTLCLFIIIECPHRVPAGA